MAGHRDRAVPGRLLTALPIALVRELGCRLQEVQPRWAKGAAHRVARLFSDHIEELDRRAANVFFE